MHDTRPGLFGIKKTNRDFSLRETWGKNQFNSSFPAALCCYLASKNIQANYLSVADKKFDKKFISIRDVFGIEFDDEDTYFAFESQHTPYQKFVIGSLPRTDLVIQRASTGECLSGLEVKLTALPDETTFSLAETRYGCEIVVRPDTIVYLACSIASKLGKDLGELLPEIAVDDWTEPSQVLKNIHHIVEIVKNLSLALEANQSAFLIQPIWKTLGKSPELAENCLDVFVWSEAGFTNFISQIASGNPNSTSINRPTRAAVWLYKMLSGIKDEGRFNPKTIIDSLSYNTKNDKAFASAGTVTHPFMECARLLKPAITKSEIKDIIVGGGQKLLSPERRFDAILFGSPGLFE
jgi:type II restriction enzyme